MAMVRLLLVFTLVLFSGSAQATQRSIIVTESAENRFLLANSEFGYACYDPEGASAPVLGRLRPPELTAGALWRDLSYQRIRLRLKRRRAVLQQALQKEREHSTRKPLQIQIRSVNAQIRSLSDARATCKSFKVSLQPTPTATPTPPDEFVLDNGRVRVEVDLRGIIKSISTESSRRSFEMNTNYPWEVKILDAVSRSRTSEFPPSLGWIRPSASSDCRVAASVEQSAAFERLVFNWSCPFSTSVGTGVLALKHFYELKLDAAGVETWLEAQMSAENISMQMAGIPLTLRVLGDREEFAITSGYVVEAFRRPEQSFPANRYDTYSLLDVVGGYWDQDGNFLSIRADGISTAVKRAGYQREEGAFTTIPAFSASNSFEPGNRIDPDHHYLIIPGISNYKGEEGWIPIADEYRTHLEKVGVVKWPVERRLDLPTQAKELDVAFYSSPLSYPLNSSERDALAAAYADAARFYGADRKILFIWETGKTPSLTYTPHHSQVDFYKKLRQSGVVPCMYTLYGAAAALDPDYELIAGEENFVSPEYQVPAAAIAPDGSLIHRFDPFSERFPAWLAYKLSQYNASGTGLGCVYVDGTHDHGAYENGLYNPRFNSVRRFGLTEDVLVGAWSFYQRLQSHMRFLDPEFFAFHESFIPSTKYAGGGALHSSQSLQFGSAASPADIRNVLQSFHFQERLMSGYNLRIGGGVAGSNLFLGPLLPYLFPGDPGSDRFDISDDYDLVLAAGMVQGGAVPFVAEYGIGKAGTETSAFPNYRAGDPQYLRNNPLWQAFAPLYRPLLIESADFLKKLVSIRRVARRFFHGRWEPFPETDSPRDSHGFWNVNNLQRAHTFNINLPRVLSAAWRAWDGKLALFFVNHYRRASEQRVAFHIDFARYGLTPGQRYKLVRLGLDGTEAVVGVISSSTWHTVTIPRKDAAIFVIEKMT